MTFTGIYHALRRTGVLGRRVPARSYLVLDTTMLLSPSEKQITTGGYMNAQPSTAVWRTRSSLAAGFKTASPGKRSHPIKPPTRRHTLFQIYDGAKQHYIRHLLALLRQLVQSRPLSSSCWHADRPKQQQLEAAAAPSGNTYVHVDRGTGARRAVQGDIGNAAVGARAASPLRLATDRHSHRHAAGAAHGGEATAGT